MAAEEGTPPQAGETEPLAADPALDEAEAENQLRAIPQDQKTQLKVASTFRSQRPHSGPGQGEA